MEFSSDVLVDFGLNLAGYIIVALLIFVLTGRRRKQVNAGMVVPVRTPPQVPSQARPISAVGASGEPEFIALSGPPKQIGREASAVPALPDRQKNRRAIYEEARRLLAAGKPHGELLRQLPVTESELDILTAAGKA
jgi:hypothetical protein